MLMTTLELIEIINSLIDESEKLSLDDNSILLGDVIDSLLIIQICVALEEKSAVDGFNFDWTSEKAMSSINSVFRTPLTLTEEYNRQKNS